MTELPQYLIVEGRVYELKGWEPVSTGGAHRVAFRVWGVNVADEKDQLFGVPSATDHVYVPYEQDPPPEIPLPWLLLRFLRKHVIDGTVEELKRINSPPCLRSGNIAEFEGRDATAQEVRELIRPVFETWATHFPDTPLEFPEIFVLRIFFPVRISHVFIGIHPMK